MSDSNKVTVKIYGHEYTIAGTKPRDHIIKVADYVDGLMADIAGQAPNASPSALAVLAAVNVADELLSQKDFEKEMAQEKEQLEKDITHYIQLWEEAKRNFLQYKDDAQASIGQRDKLQEKLNERAIENDRLLKSSIEKDEKLAQFAAECAAQIENQTADKDRRIAELTEHLGELARQIKTKEEEEAYSIEQISALEDKYKEIEGNYFEIQMENIQLKGELDRFKKLTE